MSANFRFLLFLCVIFGFGSMKNFKFQAVSGSEDNDDYAVEVSTTSATVPEPNSSIVSEKYEEKQPVTMNPEDFVLKTLTLVNSEFDGVEYESVKFHQVRFTNFTFTSEPSASDLQELVLDNVVLNDYDLTKANDGYVICRLPWDEIRLESGSVLKLSNDSCMSFKEVSTGARVVEFRQQEVPLQNYTHMKAILQPITEHLNPAKPDEFVPTTSVILSVKNETTCAIFFKKLFTERHILHNVSVMDSVFLSGVFSKSGRMVLRLDEEESYVNFTMSNGTLVNAKIMYRDAEDEWRKMYNKIITQVEISAGWTFDNHHLCGIAEYGYLHDDEPLEIRCNLTLERLVVCNRTLYDAQASYGILVVGKPRGGFLLDEESVDVIFKGFTLENATIANVTLDIYDNKTGKVRHLHNSLLYGVDLTNGRIVYNDIICGKVQRAFFGPQEYDEDLCQLVGEVTPLVPRFIGTCPTREQLFLDVCPCDDGRSSCDFTYVTYGCRRDALDSNYAHLVGCLARDSPVSYAETEEWWECPSWRPPQCEAAVTTPLASTRPRATRWIIITQPTLCQVTTCGTSVCAPVSKTKPPCGCGFTTTTDNPCCVCQTQGAH